MKSLPNIEKSAFRKDRYIGYANGVWHIAKDFSRWRAHCPATGTLVVRRTLAEISECLTRIANNDPTFRA